jgi:predicted ATPase
MTSVESSGDDGLTQAERNLKVEGKVPFFKFVLTGGPCGGKTTALARVYSFLRERGFQVITSPETFTILASNGMSGDFFAVEGMGTVIQNRVMDVQLALEESLSEILKAHGKPAVLLCDRGPMDGAAYVPEDEWNTLCEKRGVDVTDLRDNRYNAVFHMVTAADGAEAYYSLENNASRTETAEQARELDQKTQKAWLGHPHMYVFDNSTDFEGKLSRLIDLISTLVGLPNLSRRSCKFLLKKKPTRNMFPDDVAYHVFEVEKLYLVNQDADEASYSFVRKRTTIDKKTGQHRGSVYQLTTVEKAENGEIIEQKRYVRKEEKKTVLLWKEWRGNHTLCSLLTQFARILFRYCLSFVASFPQGSTMAHTRHETQIVTLLFKNASVFYTSCKVLPFM